MSEDLHIFLGPKGSIPAIGWEYGSARRNGIAKFTSPHGSIRYVYYRNRVAISVLQLVSRDDIHAQIANAYTTPAWRRIGIGRSLFKRALKDFKTINHSEHLSALGEKFKKGLE